MKKNSRFLLKRFLLSFLIVILVYSAFYFSMITYGIAQLKGQLKILNNTRPIAEMLADTNVSDSIRQKLILIEKVKTFAIDSLGLKQSKNYTTFYDQHNKPILWTLTASDPYRIKAYLWKFPLLGKVSYKGFFDYDAGKQEEISLIGKGFDTDYDEVSAWSTLGWFKDPVLSGMLRRSPGQLAELIIHEMTHATLYLKSNVDLNENLASVCGEQGAIRFLVSTYGDDSPQLMDYLNKKNDYDLYSRWMLRGTSMLDSMYNQLQDSLVIIKKIEKDKMIKAIVRGLDTIPFHSPLRYKGLFKEKIPNNAYFLNFIRYDAQKEKMKKDLLEKYDGNILRYINSLRNS